MLYEGDCQMGDVIPDRRSATAERVKNRMVPPASTLPEAQARAGRLRSALLQRNVHHDVLRFCRALSLC